MSKPREVPSIFLGEVPEDFYQQALNKYELSRQGRVAAWLTRLLYKGGPSHGILQDYFIRSLYKQLIVETAEDEARLAQYDDLTHLLNRRYLKKYGDEMLRSVGGVRQTDPAGAVAFKVDIVGFKELNDVMGYPAGDAALVTTAEFLSAQLRDSDILGRWGGDEFVLLAPVAQGWGTRQVSEVIEQRLYEIPQSEDFPRQLRWDCHIWQPGEDTQGIVDSIDINTPAAKDSAKYSRPNLAYSIS